MSETIDNKSLVAKYFNQEEISAIKELGNRLIVTINTKENKEKADALKAELEQNNSNKKVNIIFVEDKKETPSEPQKWQIKGVKNIIAITSAKGGVGKSTTSVNVALALANQGLKVALFDADIYGPSVPTMLGYNNIPVSSYDGKTFEPYQECGIKSMSIGSMISKDTALIWRGAKACGAIQQLMTETNWGEIDVMVIDMPPGTGDIQITMLQKLELTGAIIVSTPQDIALIDAIKGLNLFKKLDVPIFGVIENMSYYICEKCGHRADIFGHAGAEKTAKQYGVDFLGAIPLHYDIRVNADSGTPIVLSAPDSEHTKVYMDISSKIAEKFK